MEVGDQLPWATRSDGSLASKCLRRKALAERKIYFKVFKWFMLLNMELKMLQTFFRNLIDFTYEKITL